MKIILGGGITGLSASYYALKKNPKEALTLIESSNRVGGWIKSTLNTDNNNIIFEQGPRTIRPKGKNAANTLRLLEDLNLSNAVVPINSSHPAAKNRLIYANNSLHMLPTSLTAMFKQQTPFSKPLIMQMAQDIYAPSKKIHSGDEPIYDFVERRFGKEVADYLISPMICGICGGNAKEISVKFLMEYLFELEQSYGSISKGLLRNFFRKTSKEFVLQSQLLKRSKEESWNVYYMQKGLETLPKTLYNETFSVVDYKLNNTCTDLKFHDSIAVKLDSGSILDCDHLISAISAENLAKLVEKDHPNLANLLCQIQNVSLAVINLQYNQKDLIKNPGFGFLVCPQENLPILGVIYDSCCFNYTETTVLTVMMGGHWFQKYFNYKTKEEEFLEVALTNVEKILQISMKPDKYKVNILHNAIPQYKVGHQSIVKNIEKYISDKNLKLSICGSSYYGVGINDVIASAKNCIDGICF